MPSDPVLIRQFNPAIKGEENFILSTWLRDLHDADSSGLPNDLWFAAHRAHIQNCLADRASTVLIAAAADDPEQILGYIVAYPGSHLEWVMIGKKFRNEGLAKRLLLAAQCPPGTPARFATALSRSKLQNPCRSRALRAQRSSTANG